jgi:hypothetical protein
VLLAMVGIALMVLLLAAVPMVMSRQRVDRDTLKTQGEKRHRHDTCHQPTDRPYLFSRRCQQFAYHLEFHPPQITEYRIM